MTLTRRSLLVSAAGAVVAAAAPVAAAQRRPRALALVTADLEAAIVVVDPATGRSLRRIACDPGPRSIERVGASDALVAHSDEGLVSLIDGPARRVARVLEGFAEPRYAAISADARHAYVTDSGTGQVVTIDLARGRVVRRTEVGGPARHLGLSPDGRSLWTALGSVASRVAVLDLADPARPRLVRRLAPPFAAHDVAAAPEGDRFWVTSGEGGTIAVYGGGGRLRFTLAADAAPQHVAFADGVAYVASGDSGTLRAHRLSDGRRMWTTQVPAGSYNVTTGGGWVATPSLPGGTLAIARTGARSARAPGVARSAHDACLVSRGR